MGTNGLNCIFVNIFIWRNALPWKQYGWIYPFTRSQRLANFLSQSANFWWIEYLNKYCFVPYQYAAFQQSCSHLTQMYPGFPQTLKVENFAIKVNLLAIVWKHSILVVYGSPGYVSLIFRHFPLQRIRHNWQMNFKSTLFQIWKFHYMFVFI